MDDMVKNNSWILDFFIHLTEFLVALTVVFDCNSVYRVMRLGVSTRLLTVFGINIFSGLLIILWIIKDNTNKECVINHKLLFLLSFIFVFLFYAVNASQTDNVGYFGYFLFFMNLMVILYNIYRKNNDTFRLLYLIEEIVVVIAAISFILWIGSSILNLWGMNEDVFVEWGGKYYNANYLNLCIRRWNVNFLSDTTKNLGIFCEPPMFGLMLGFGIYVELFLKKKTNIVSVIILLCALISSRAILAIMICIVGLYFKGTELWENKKRGKILSLSMLAVGLICICGLAIYKYNKQSVSFLTHLDDFKASFKCWLNNPLFGCGYNTPDPITQYMSEFRNDNLGLSNSILVVLAEGGLFLWLYYVFPFIILIISYFKNNKKTAYWAIGMFFFWVAVVFHLRLLIFIILALGYSMIDLYMAEDANKKKSIKIKIKWFDENNNLDSMSFVKHPFCVPSSFGIIMTGILGGASVYCLINVGKVATLDILCSVVVLLGIIILVLMNVKYPNCNKFVNLAFEVGLWLVFMLVGNLYKVFDAIFLSLHLYIQDCWWSSVLAVVILYALGILIEKEVGKCEKK